MRKSSTPNFILGVQLKAFDRPPDFTIYRFRVYMRERITILSLEAQKLNLNFQIEGENEEKLVVRIFKNVDGSFQRGSYYSLKVFDKEIAEYLVKALIQKLHLRVPNFNDVQLKQVYIAQEKTNFNIERN